jgi:hypothetical protein
MSVMEAMGFVETGSDRIRFHGITSGTTGNGDGDTNTIAQNGKQKALRREETEDTSNQNSHRSCAPTGGSETATVSKKEKEVDVSTTSASSCPYDEGVLEGSEVERSLFRKRVRRRSSSSEGQQQPSRRKKHRKKFGHWDQKLSPSFSSLDTPIIHPCSTKTSVWSLVLSLAHDAQAEGVNKEVYRKNLSNCVQRLPFFTSFELLSATMACAKGDTAFLPFFINDLRSRLLKDSRKDSRAEVPDQWDLPNLLLTADMILQSGKGDSTFFQALAGYLDTVPKPKFNLGLSAFVLSIFSKAKVEKTMFIQHLKDHFRLRPGSQNCDLGKSFKSFSSLLPWEKFQFRQLFQSIQ